MDELGRADSLLTTDCIVQANAVSDKVLDLRQCKLHGSDLTAKVLSGALVADADFSRTNLREIVLTKVDSLSGAGRALAAFVRCRF